MKTIRILLLALLASAAFVCPRAQAQIGQITNPVSAPLHAQDAGTCSATANSNLIQQLPPNASTTTVNLSGTFSATVTVRASNNGGATWVTLGTASAAGTTTYGTNSYTHLCADVTTYTSGTVNVTISTGVVGGGNGNSGSVSLPTTQVSAASYAGADWCAKVQAADAAIGANPGIIVVPSTIAGTCAGTLTFAYNGSSASRVMLFDLGTFTGAIAPLPNDGAASPTMAPFRFEGQLSSTDALNKTSTGGSFLNLTNNAAVAKIETLGAATLEIDHLNIEDTSTDCSPFLLTTNTMLKIHNNVFIGTASGTSACNDAIILGGTDATNGNLPTSAFSGYGTTIRDNSFEQIRRVVLLQSNANGIDIVDNNIDANSGFSTGGAIELNPASGTSTNGNYIAGNLVEITNYKYFVNVTAASGKVQMNNFVGNGLWDASATTNSFFNFNETTDTNSNGNFVLLGQGTSGKGIAAHFGNNYYLGPNNFSGSVVLNSANDDGTCTMTTTSCTVSNLFRGTHCIATVQGASAIAAACNISGTTATVTAASSNSATWAVWTF